MPPFIRVSPFHISIIKSTFRDKQEPRSTQIVGMVKHAQNNRLLLHFGPDDFY